ncbi:hypothetical protein STEG23_032013 [Scotinomys teguina]
MWQQAGRRGARAATEILYMTHKLPGHGEGADTDIRKAVSNAVNIWTFSSNNLASDTNSTLARCVHLSMNIV